MSSDLEASLLRSGASVRDAIETIDRSPHKIALVVDPELRLLGTVTDGDVRRALLAGKATDEPVDMIMYGDPLIAADGHALDDVERVARKRIVRKVPVLDRDHRVVRVHTVGESSESAQQENVVVLMAGGLGTRLHPLTENSPKPMLNVGEKPILETIFDQLIDQGFRKFYFSVRYKAEMVEAHFHEGKRWGAEISYLHEESPLGTAGALSLLPERPVQPLIVMNADVLTKVDLAHLLDFHAQGRAIATMCVRAYDFQIPYGVVSTDGADISSIEEKPVQKIFVNAGIYVLSPEVLDRVPSNERLDMPDLFNGLIADGHRVMAFPIREYWIDVGRLEDYHRANDDYAGEFS
jgi:dTDP-glucose pyrophosphorylase